jgi:hypothetical protein
LAKIVVTSSGFDDSLINILLIRPEEESICSTYIIMFFKESKKTRSSIPASIRFVKASYISLLPSEMPFGIRTKVHIRLRQKPRKPRVKTGGSSRVIEIPLDLIAEISLSEAILPRPSNIPTAIDRGATVTRVPGRAFAKA